MNSALPRSFAITPIDEYKSHFETRLNGLFVSWHSCFHDKWINSGDEKGQILPKFEVFPKFSQSWLQQQSKKMQATTQLKRQILPECNLWFQSTEENELTLVYTEGP